MKDKPEKDLVDTGGQVYPELERKYSNPRVSEGPMRHYELRGGMTLLDFFAGQALAGMYANKRSLTLKYEDLTDAAYAQAEAMIAEKRRLEA